LKFDVLSIFRKYVEEIKDPLNMIRITDTLHEDQYTVLIISRSFPLRMRNVSDKFVEKIKTRILCSLRFFENRAVYEKMWDYIYSHTDHR
jgi:hypothetical protein